ncbi:tRNA epoxyqueuosine(34) reductase QueG [Aliidiomarina sanyensis]|uniref:Epoxyqueuosine reductase n=1 Tax=Aliidiomarina sanyensis TaxID=1249555 RepID=A0A432WP98_9GAMM|nr:tRNA epoxyqueuosine(34) reductase QueG [Aliidiomarina sanyensis]RUO35622.1 tRNA epoxyqueuosine(34) reductase QueG [Aliidiomarina sanyensis]
MQNSESKSATTVKLSELVEKIKQWGSELGFQKVGIADLDLSKHESALQEWLDNQYHGTMDYMERHGMLRARPADLHPGSVRAISVRMNYLPPNARFAEVLGDDKKAFVSRYALGRDYHKVMRKRLQKLGAKITDYCLTHLHDVMPNFRPFVDSAPILERPLAEKAGLGWTGKHTLLLDTDDGSWFFLGELLINLPLPIDQPQPEQCGKCTACITICPTQAIVAPYKLDARRCISYLTIEHAGPIPEAFRRPMGNRIYGCDDCQLVCPWNRYATPTPEEDFLPRHPLHAPELLELWAWDEATFLERTEGSPIRRIGFERWQRNLAVAFGNARPSADLIEALEQRLPDASPLVGEHIEWALAELRKKALEGTPKNLQLDRLIRIVEKGLPRDA